MENKEWGVDCIWNKLVGGTISLLTSYQVKRSGVELEELISRILRITLANFFFNEHSCEFLWFMFWKYGFIQMFDFYILCLINTLHIITLSCNHIIYLSNFIEFVLTEGEPCFKFTTKHSLLPFKTSENI